MRPSYRFFGFLILMTSTLAIGQFSIAAQMPPGAVSQQEAVSEVSPLPQDQFLLLVQPRDRAEIRRDIEMAEQVQSTAKEAEQIAQEQQAAAAARIEEKKQAISANKDRLKIAKKEKNEAEILVLTTELKALERDKDLYEQRESLRGAEIDLAKNRGELASLSKQAFDLELQLELKREEQPEFNPSGPETARATRVLIDLEKATLEMQKKVADKQGEVADSAKKVVDRQLKTLEAQLNIYAGK